MLSNKKFNEVVSAQTQRVVMRIVAARQCTMEQAYLNFKSSRVYAILSDKNSYLYSESCDLIYDAFILELTKGVSAAEEYLYNNIC